MCCWAQHRWKAQGAERRLHMAESEDLMRLLQVKLLWWIVGTAHESTAHEFSLSGRTSLRAAKLIPEGNGMERANWLLRMLCVLVCTHPSFPCLLCNASLAVGNRSALKWDQGSTGVSFLKAPGKCTLPPACPTANVSGDFNVSLALFHYVLVWPKWNTLESFILWGKKEN